MGTYKPTSYFFIDVTGAVVAATAADGFGPVSGALTSKFRTTSFIRTSGTKKVFAICDGQLLVQPHATDATKVNLILKPLKSFSGLKIKFFIYRGVNKADLINGSNLKDKNDADPNQPDWLKRLWKEYLDFNLPFYEQGIIDTPPDTFPAKQIGYGQQVATTLIDHVFTYKNATEIYQIPQCKVGEYIGNFTTRIGLDVVLDYGDYELTNQDQLFKLDLVFARSAENVLDTTIIPASTAVKVKRFREHVLQFIDAAAFWGSHINCGTIKTNAGDKVTVSDIASNIVARFFTKNKMYLYTQGEHNRSYNYYDTTRKIFGFTTNGELAKTNEWPVLIKTIASSSENNTKAFQLYYQIDVNADPPQGKYTVCLFTGNNTDLSGYPKETYVTKANGNTNDIVLNYCAHGGDSCATFVLINALLRGVVPVMDYYNNLFTPNINTTQVFGTSNETGLSWASYIGKRLVDLTEILGTTALVQEKVVFDKGLNLSGNTRKARRLYCAVVEKAAVHNAEFNEYAVPEITAGNVIAIRNKEQYFNAVYNDINFTVYKGTFTDSQTNATITSLSVVHHQNFLKKNSYYHLGISEEEYNKLVFDNPAPVASTPQKLPVDAQNVRFYLNEITAFMHENVRKYEVGLWYEDNTGNRTTTPLYPSAANKVYVYSLDGHFFFSKQYTDHQEYYVEFAKLRVDFRANESTNFDPTAPLYDGEFGIDWLRIPDDELVLQVPPYKDIIVNGYKRPSVQSPATTEYATAAQAYKALVNEYKTIATQNSNEVYEGSYLSLFSQDFSNKFKPNANDSSVHLTYKAQLLVLVQIDNSLAATGDIVFDYNPEYFQLSTNSISNRQQTTIKEAAAPAIIEITCKKDFAIPQQVYVWAYPTASRNKRDAQLAGILLITRNDHRTRVEQKIVLVKVKTNIDLTRQGSFSPAEKIKVINGLGHSLIASSVYEETNYFLDVTNNAKFKMGGIYVDSNGFLLHPQAMFDECRSLFLNDDFNGESNQKYKDYFTVFAFDEEDPNDYVGFIQDFGTKNAIMFRYPARGNETLIHEAYHGFRLRHTHRDTTPITDPNQKYIYPKYNTDPNEGPINTIEATDNIMSYNYTKKTTWYWQWLITNGNIK